MQLEKLKKMQKLNQAEMNFIYGSTALTGSTSGDVSSEKNDSYSQDSKKDDKPTTSIEAA
jgi:hypothetical protein